MSLFMSSMLGAVTSGPVYPAHSSRRVAFNGSACWVEMTTVWIFLGSTDPSAFCRYSIVTCVLPSGLSLLSGDDNSVDLSRFDRSIRLLQIFNRDLRLAIGS